MAKTKKVLYKDGPHKWEHVKFTGKKQKTEDVKCSVCGITGSHVVDGEYVEVEITRKNKKDLVDNCKAEEVPQEQKITLKLPVDFSAEELSDFSRVLSGKVLEIGKLEVEKKAAVSSFNGQIDEAHSIVVDLSNKINRGSEDRDVECLVRFHQPKKDMKTVIRLDTNKFVGEMPMEEQDFNLFTQYNKDENGEEQVIDNPQEEMTLVGKDNQLEEN